MDAAAQEGPSVAAVIFDVVSGVEQVAQARQVVFCDCLVSRGERLLLEGRDLSPNEMFAACGNHPAG